MKGKLFQINDVDGEQIGLWYTKANISNESITNWFYTFLHDGIYNEEGFDGFKKYVRLNHGYVVERVFVEEINL